MTKTAKAASLDPVPGKAVEPGFERIIALIIWKQRHHLDGPLVRITQKDVAAFDQSLAYNQQAPVVNIEERNGAILVHLTDQAGDQIVFTENNEDDLDRAQAKATTMMLRQSAPQLAQQVLSGMARGEMSDSDVRDLCNAVAALARAQ